MVGRSCISVPWTLRCPLALATVPFLFLALPAAAQRAKTSQSYLDDLAFSKPEIRVTVQSVAIDPLRQGLSHSEALAVAPMLADWDRFQTDRDGHWILLLDRVTGRPAHMEGRGIPWIPGTANDLTGYDLGLPAGTQGRKVPVRIVAGLAKDFLAAYPDLFGVGAEDLILVPDGSGPVLDYLYFLNFQWTHHGVPVDQAHLIFRLNHGNLVQVGQESISPEAIRTLDPAPAITLETAWQILWGYVGGQTSVDEIIQPGQLLIVPVSSPEALSGESVSPGEGIAYRLSYELAFRRAGNMGTWRARIDAHSGELLEFLDANRYGSIHGGAYPGDRPAPEADRSFPYADTGLVAPNNFADSAGVFPGSSATSTLSGKYVRIQDKCGSISLSTSSGDLDFGSSSGTNCTTPGIGGAGNTHAARTQYYNVTLIKIKALTYLPTNTWLQGQILDKTNLTSDDSSYCPGNAWWDGTNVNFCIGDSTYGNTGELPGVSLHEWAHGLDSNDGSPSGDNGTGETYGDFSGVLQTHGSCVGNGFYLSGANCSGYGDACISCSGIRQIDWDMHSAHSPHFPEDLTSNACVGCTTYACASKPTYAGPCGREGHCESLVSSEAMWDLPVRDLTSWGLDAVTAWQLMDRLWYASRTTSGKAYDCPSVTTANGCGTSNYFTTFRVVDDCDGDLSNGTPHASAIFNAFNRHKIACTSVVNTDQADCCPPISTPILSGAAGNAQASLSWNSVANAAKYYVYRNESGCSAGYTKVGTVAAPSTSFTDSPLTNGLTYYYRVQAIGSSEACTSPMSNCLTLTPSPCTPPDVPTIGTVAVSGENQLSVPWAPGASPGATYNIYRSVGACPGGAYSRIAGGVAISPYIDSTVSGGTTYSYKVSAVDSTGGCESLQSACASATATGSCTIPPTFAGVSSVVNPGSASCTLVLSWSSGTSNCSDTLSYNVYRSTSSSFTPSLANRIAAGIIGTGYTDTSALSNGTPYYYIVRAVEIASGVEESNLVTKSATPSGSSAVIFSDDFEGGNLGWTFSKGSPAATTGDFIIGDPVGTTGNLGEQAQPENDHTPVPGVNCLYTAANPTGAAGTNDVDGGEVIATSPTFNAAGYSSVTISLWRWFLNEYINDDSGDYYRLEISNNNGSSWVLLESLPDSVTGNNAWTNVTFQVQDFVSLSSAMKIRLRAADGTAVGGLVEAAIDDVVITGYIGCTTGLVGPPGVPDGTSGSAMTCAKTSADGSAVTLNWDATCAGAQYEIVYGTDGTLPTSFSGTYGLTGVQCSIGTSGTYAWNGVPAVPPESKFLWWLVVATDGAVTEGSWGKNTSQERTGPGSAGSSQGASGACVATKNLANTCGQ